MILSFIGIAEQLPKTSPFKYAHLSLSNEFNSAQVSLNQIYIYIPKGEVYHLFSYHLFLYILCQLYTRIKDFLGNKQN